MEKEREGERERERRRDIRREREKAEVWSSFVPRPPSPPPLV